MDFRYKTTVDLIFAWGSSSLIGYQTARYGKNVLIVTGKNSTRKSGLLERAQVLLKEEGLRHMVFDQVTQNPLIATVNEGAELARKLECDVILALGGGSIMDAAKGIAAKAVSRESIENFIYDGIPVEKALPIVAVPTTCGTGSEVNQIAVLTNGGNRDKKSFKSPWIMPKVSIVDPQLMTTMPKAVYASVAFDALCHLMEAYLSAAANPISDLYAAEGMRLLSKKLVAVYEDSGDQDGWEAVTLASTYGGFTLNSVGVIAGHALEHPLSGLKDVAHGRGLAAVFPAIIAELTSLVPGRIADISRILGGRDEKDCVNVLKGLLRKLDLCVTLRDLGFTKEDIPWLSDNCLRVSKGTLDRTPADWNREDVERIYHKSMTFNQEKERKEDLR